MDGWATGTARRPHEWVLQSLTRTLLLGLNSVWRRRRKEQKRREGDCFLFQQRQLTDAHFGDYAGGRPHVDRLVVVTGRHYRLGSVVARRGGRHRQVSLRSDKTQETSVRQCRRAGARESAR